MYGNETVLIAIAMMWNISISVLFCNGEIVKIYHDKDEADVVIVSNGTGFDTTNHFVGSGKILYLIIFGEYL